MQQIIDYLSQRTRFHFKSYGKSMLPVIYPGDIVYLRRCKFRSVSTNDIILVKKKRKVFIHRIIFVNNILKKKPYIITKGDNNMFSDGKVYPDDIVGKVYQIKRRTQIFHPDNIYLLQSTLYFQEIVKLKKMFEKEKIDIVFLKGLPLHLYFEKAHPRRIYADCDILIERPDLPKMDKILHKCGYQVVHNALTPILRILKNRMTEISYTKRINDFWIVFDIHLDAITLINQFGTLDILYPTKYIDALNKEFLLTKRIVTIQNEQYPILSPVNLILYFAYNHFHHNCRGIFRLQLLDKAIINKKINWIELEDKIKYYQLQNFIYPVFLLLQKYFLTSIPKNYLESIAPEENILHYIEKRIPQINIFDSQSRVDAGKERFKNIYFLSPHQWWRKWLIFLNPAVIYSITWVLYRKLLYSFTPRVYSTPEGWFGPGN